MAVGEDRVDGGGSASPSFCVVSSDESGIGMVGREQATNASRCHLWSDDDKIFGEAMMVVRRNERELFILCVSVPGTCGCICLDARLGGPRDLQRFVSNFWLNYVYRFCLLHFYYSQCRFLGETNLFSLYAIWHP